MKIKVNEERTAAKVRPTEGEDWEAEYKRIKANGRSALSFLQGYLDQDTPDPAIKWTNNGFIGDLVQGIQNLVRMVRESDPKGADKAASGRTAAKYR